jgi:hypothetical protein
VQSDHYEEFFMPEMQKAGYTAVYKTKTAALYTGSAYTIDGCATFFRADRFSLVKKYEVEFNKAALSLSEALSAANQKKAALNRLLKVARSLRQRRARVFRWEGGRVVGVCTAACGWRVCQFPPLAHIHPPRAAQLYAIRSHALGADCVLSLSPMRHERIVAGALSHARCDLTLLNLTLTLPY